MSGMKYLFLLGQTLPLSPTSPSHTTIKECIELLQREEIIPSRERTMPDLFKAVYFTVSSIIVKSSIIGAQ